MENIACTLREAAAKTPEKTGLIEAAGGKEMTFAELESRSDSYAFLFAENGVNAGDRVMLMVRPSADFICLTFALFKIGAAIILIDPGMGEKNLLRCIKSVRPDILVGIPKACLLRSVFPAVFSTIRKTFCCGFCLGLFGGDIRKKAYNRQEAFPIYRPKDKDLAAIIFTTGSTGPPKGVRYEHAIFSAQLKHIRDYYKISSADIDQPAFPLFALFSTALGACAVIPDMDPTRPAQVDPEKFINSIEKYGVTYSFGSPAIWRVVAEYCRQQGRRLDTLNQVLMAGAPISGGLIERFFAVIAENGRIFTPYGATESLPIISMEGREIVQDTWPLTKEGKGYCVGRTLPGISMAVIKPTSRPITDISAAEFLEAGQAGEIIVKGNVVTKAYDHNPAETRMAKIPDGEDIWHRMGDIGYLDQQGRLWFCGRKAHRVETENGTKYTICCEAIANNHPEVFRSALVGITDGHSKKYKIPVMVIEKKKNSRMPDAVLLEEVRELCRKSPLTSDIDIFLVHPGFPVDIRHNAKIFREKIAVWAEEQNG
ncbi:MAG: peptide synthase [Deltaproteobacteria bacterium]|nr:MAG: peptide synthase [Deltaproteobacteria bacterium]